MKISNLLFELERKEFFEEFIKQNPSAYPCAIFSVLSKTEDDKHQVDFYIPEKEKMAFSEYPFQGMKIAEEKVSKIKPLPEKVEIDLEDLWEKVEETIADNAYKIIPQKIIAILKDSVWNLTVMDDSLGMVRIFIDAVSGEISKSEKGSLMDFMAVKKLD